MLEGDTLERYHQLYDRGMAASSAGDFPRSEKFLDAAYVLARECGDARGQLAVLPASAWADRSLGNVGRASQKLQIAAGIIVRLGLLDR